ncbi:hypothetical protein B795N_02130 [Marinilactibacillus psychrotolerans]|nr:hypothetical protein B795N_02130 [Marinilactibacillus psychrotolerans]
MGNELNYFLFKNEQYYLKDDKSSTKAFYIAFLLLKYRRIVCED